ncbi:CRISPR-associated protein Csy3 [compost metagenome]
MLGQAAIRDTKAANALRTIDTWYPEFDDYRQPIAVELAGANLEAQRIFRTGEDTAFAYAKRLNDIDPNSPQGMFMIASLVRGGVYLEKRDR